MHILSTRTSEVNTKSDAFGWITSTPENERVIPRQSKDSDLRLKGSGGWN